MFLFYLAPSKYHMVFFVLREFNEKEEESHFGGVLRKRVQQRDTNDGEILEYDLKTAGRVN